MATCTRRCASTAPPSSSELTRDQAYLEFFAPPSHVAQLLDLIERTPALTYHAVNKQGDLRTNTNAGPNAVTWGVFPGTEIIQPTVVEAMSFLAWKDEAFELGAQWGQLYAKTSPATETLIKGIMDTYYLGATPLPCEQS